MLQYLNLAAPQEIPEANLNEIRKLLQHPIIRCFLATELKAALEVKLAHRVDPKIPESYLQEETYLRGGCDRLVFLLEMGDPEVVDPQGKTAS